MASPIPPPGPQVRSQDRPRSKAGTAACVRCRQKKKRCDQKLPRCRLCENAGVECYGYEPAARRQVPRSYVQSLEERVAYLEAKLRDTAPQERDNDPPTPSESASLESLLDPVISPVHKAPDMGHGIDNQRPPGPEAELSRILLHQVPQGRQDPSHRSPCDIVGNLDTGPITLPTREAAGNLVREFFQSANLGMPLLHEPTFARKLALVYDMPRTVNLAVTHTTPESRTAVFFVLEVFAIALLTMQKQDPTRIPTWLADRYHKAAAAALAEAGLPGGVEGVQALLLVGQFYYFHPTLWTVWNTVGAALRLAVELGLHRDPPPGEEGVDALRLDTRRRAFWVAYSMDRNISIAKSIPTCLSDGAIDVKFPSEMDDSLITSEGIATAAASQVSGSKLVSLHLLQYRQMQSEMRTVLYERPSPAHTPIPLKQWQQQMRDRIDRWYAAIPLSDRLNIRDRIVIETFDLTYNTALFYLYRPSPNDPHLSGAQWVAMAHAAMAIVQLHRRFFLENKLTLYWQAVELVSSAGTALMRGYGASAQLRACVGFRAFESTLHTCSSILWGMVERFPAFQSKRDEFEANMARVLADLSSGSPSMSGGGGGMAAGDTPGGTVAMSARGTSDQRVSRVSPGGAESEAAPYAQHVPGEMVDFGDLTMIWEATVDWSGTPAPTWI